jgi:GxxExxY protein
MRDAGLDISRDHTMHIYYRGKYTGKRRVDVLVEQIISVEIKALTSLEDVHLVEAIN